MARGLKTLLVIVSVAMVIYLASLGKVSMAEVGSAGAEQRVEGAIVSLEAFVVQADVGDLAERARGSDLMSLGSIPAEAILTRVKNGHAEMASSVRLLVASGALGEVSAEDEAGELEKNSEQKTGGKAKRASSVSFRAEVLMRNAGMIAVEFSFKQVLSENASSGSGQGQQEEEVVRAFEVSSQIGLQAGRPCVVGAKRNDDEAVFLILQADI